MKKPQVICHMMSSVDGRIISANWGDAERRKTFGSIYEKCHASFESQAWMCGRVTLEKDFTRGEQPELVKREGTIARTPFIGDKAAASFAIAIDPKGKLGWKSNNISGDHVIEILTEEVTDAYLYYLQQKGISYLFAGREAISFTSALSQLSALFPIRTIMLEGGGHINGSLLNEDLIDELSLLILPIVDGTVKTPTSFEVAEYLQKRRATELQLKEVKQLEEDVTWLRYRIKR